MTPPRASRSARRLEPEQLDEVGDLEDPPGGRPEVTQHQLAVSRREAPLRVDERGQPGRVEEREPGTVDDDARMTLVDEGEQFGAERRRFVDVDLAGHDEDRRRGAGLAGEMETGG